jgi:hypothetical protein
MALRRSGIEIRAWVHEFLVDCRTVGLEVDAYLNLLIYSRLWKPPFTHHFQNSSAQHRMSGDDVHGGCSAILVYFELQRHRALDVREPGERRIDGATNLSALAGPSSLTAMSGVGTAIWAMRYRCDGLSGAPRKRSSYFPPLRASNAGECSRMEAGGLEVGNPGSSMTPGPTARSSRSSSCIVHDVCLGVLAAGSNMSLSRTFARIIRV